MKKILITGFEPFNRQSINPSKQLVDALEPPQGVALRKAILPVEYKGAELLLKNIVCKEKPDIILSIGQAGNVPHISVETTAINIDSSLSADGKNILPDNSGYAPIDQFISPDNPNAFFSSLPTRAMVDAVNKEGIPAALSYSAGTFVCNHVMYIGCLISHQSKTISSGFVHVPFLPEQISHLQDRTSKYSMPFSDMKRAMKIILDVLSHDSES